MGVNEHKFVRVVRRPQVYTNFDEISPPAERNWSHIQIANSCLYHKFETSRTSFQLSCYHCSSMHIQRLNNFATFAKFQHT